MAYNQDHKLKDFYSRTNKLANDSNGLKMKVERLNGPQLEFVGDFVVNTGANTLTFTPSGATAAYDFRFLQMYVVDASGNAASATGTGVVASLAVDVTELNANDNWLMTVYASTDKDLLLDKGVKTFAQIEINEPANDPTVSVNTVLEDAQQIAVFEADGTTAIADAGAAYALGTYPASGGSEAQSLVIKNTGDKVLVVSAIAISADVDGGTISAPVYIYPNKAETIAFTIDTSGAAGAKTGSLTITSDDPANASYVVNVAFTLS